MSTQKHVHECARSSPISVLCLTKVGSSLGEPQLQVRHVRTLVPLSQHPLTTFPTCPFHNNWNSASFNSAYPAKTGTPAQTPSSLAGFLTSSQIYPIPWISSCFLPSVKWRPMKNMVRTALGLATKPWESRSPMCLWNGVSHNSKAQILYTLSELCGCTRSSTRHAHYLLLCQASPSYLFLCEVTQEFVASVSALLGRRPAAKSIISGTSMTEFKLHFTT